MKTFEKISGESPAPRSSARLKAVSLSNAKSPKTLHSGSRSILVVDGDRVFRRYMEIALGRMKTYSVESAEDAQAALDVLTTLPVHLLICDLNMPVMDGLQFLQRLRREERFKHIPVLFTCTKSGPATRISVLRAGGEDVMEKPIDVGELSAQLDAIFARRERERSAFLSRSYTLAGDFSVINFADLISLLEAGKRSGSLSLITTHTAGEIIFRSGFLLSARFGNLVGTEAFYKMMEFENGAFDFTPSESLAKGAPITTSTIGLLMEGARRLDQRRQNKLASGSTGEGSASRSGEMAAQDLVQDVFVRSADAVDVGWASQLEETLSDEFCLGELRLLTPSQLKEWTSVSNTRRLHILLVGGSANGTASMAAIASPLADSQIGNTLSERIRAVSLVFTLPGDQIVDLVLLDQMNPEELVWNLRREPDLLIVAPNQGDWLSMPVKARVGLVNLLRRTSPRAILTACNSSAQSCLEELQRLAGVNIPYSVMNAALGETDLRSLLIEGLRVWKSTAAESNRE